jgi:hypothetical protein
MDKTYINTSYEAEVYVGLYLLNIQKALGSIPSTENRRNKNMRFQNMISPL